MSRSPVTDHPSTTPTPTDRSRDSGKGGGSLERVTVNLTARSAAALTATAELTSETRTDVINKALQLYGFLRPPHDNGGAIYIREPNGKETDRLRLM